MVAPAWSPNRLPRPHPIWKLCQGRFGDLAWLWSLSSGVRLAVQPQKDCGLSASLAAHVAFGTVCFPVRKVLARNSTAFPRASLLMGLPHQHSINPCTSRRSLQKFRLFYFLSFLHSVLSLLFIKPVSNGFVGCLHATGAKPRPPNSLRVGRSAWLCCGDAAAVLLLRGAVLGPQPSPGEGAAPGAHSPCQH